MELVTRNCAIIEQMIMSYANYLGDLNTMCSANKNPVSYKYEGRQRGLVAQAFKNPNAARYFYNRISTKNASL